MQNRIIPSFLAFTALGLNATMPLAAQTRPTPPAASTLPSPSQPGQTTLPSISQPEETTLPAPTRPVVRPPVTTKPVYPTNPVYPTRPTYPTSNDGFAGRIRCESKNNRLHRCAVSTENRVVLLTRHGGTCEHNRGYGYTSSAIWVSRNCRATFAYGYGNNSWSGNDGDRDDDGVNPALVIGGVIVAGGLIALLASKKKAAAAADATEETKTFPPGPPAALTADLSSYEAAIRPALQTCMFEASRQIGATGGSALRLDRVTKTEPGNGGYRFNAELTATYPDGEHTLPMYCRATPSKVVQMDFTTG